jgi:hypothetical protein
MSSPDAYRGVKLKNGHLVDQVKNLNQTEWVTVCRKLGLFVPDGYGKGSHCAVYKNELCPPEVSSCCVVTLPQNIYPNFQRDLIKKLLFYGIQTGTFTEDDLWKVLRVK